MRSAWGALPAQALPDDLPTYFLAIHRRHSRGPSAKQDREGPPPASRIDAGCERAEQGRAGRGRVATSRARVHPLLEGREAGLPALPLTGLLEAALRLAPEAGAAAWLSPAARRALLERHAEGNAAIARDFLGRPGLLFLEPPPADDGEWAPYPGLSPERAAAIARAVREVHRAGRPARAWWRLRRWLLGPG
jgi:hypothetical protein